LAMKILNTHQSGINFLANFKDASMSFSVSSGTPSMNEQAVCILFLRHSLKAVSIRSSVVFLPMHCRTFCDPDSTPNHMVLHPALLIASKSSWSTKSTRVSHTHSKSKFSFFIRLHSSTVSFFLRVK